MAWPFTPTTPYVAASAPAVKASDLNLWQTYFNHIFNGTRSVKRWMVDALGNTDSSAVPLGTARLNGNNSDETIPCVQMSRTPVTRILVAEWMINGTVKGRRYADNSGTYTGMLETVNAFWNGTGWETDFNAESSLSHFQTVQQAYFGHAATAPATPWLDAAWGRVTPGMADVKLELTGDVTAARALRAGFAVSGTAPNAAIAIGEVYKDTAPVGWGVIKYTGAAAIALTRGAGVTSVTRNGVGLISVLMNNTVGNILAPTLTVLDTSATNVRLIPANLGAASFQFQLEFWNNATTSWDACDLPSGSGVTFDVKGG